MLYCFLKKSGDFEWTQTEQSWILSSFFYGYAASQPIAGLLSGRYGGKWVFGLGNLITAIGTLLTPLIANTSKELFILVRVVEGLAEVNLSLDNPNCMFYLVRLKYYRK